MGLLVKISEISENGNIEPCIERNKYKGTIIIFYVGKWGTVDLSTLELQKPEVTLEINNFTDCEINGVQTFIFQKLTCTIYYFCFPEVTQIRKSKRSYTSSIPK